MRNRTVDFSRKTLFSLMVFGFVKMAVAQEALPREKGFLPRGTRQWMAIGIMAEPLPIHSRDDGRTFAMTSLTWGQIMLSPRGPSLVRGQLEWGFEIMPLMVMRQTNTTRAFGGSPIFFRWRMQERRRIAPYTEINGGAIYSNHEIPEHISRFNFTAQAGAGLLLRVTAGHSLVLGYRLHHISNGGIGPSTRSVNSNMIIAGVTF